MPLVEGDCVFVIKPPNWSVPLGPGGLPQFSYLHQPIGSPKAVPYRHAGVAPTGDLPNSIDFALRRQEESKDFDALLLADTQPANDRELGYLRDDIVAGLLGNTAAFAINHGDVVFDDLSLYPRYLQVIGATGIPWHHCPGNHDINQEAHEDRFSRETWKRVFGPRHYAFQHAGTTFIMLDNVHYAGRNLARTQGGTYGGRIGNQQLQFIRNVLAHVPRDQLVVLSMHIPLVTYQDPSDLANNTIDRAALLEILAGRPNTVSFSGHMHLTEHHYLGAHAHHHHVLAAASGGWWGGPHDRRGIPLADCPDGVPNGFHVLEVRGSHYSTRFVPAPDKARGRLRAIIDGPHRQRPLDATSCDGGAVVCRDEINACNLIVNVFDGGPRTRVAYEIAGRASLIQMKRMTMPDPVVAKLFARAPRLQAPWVTAVPASHIWTAPLPPGLQSGVHRLAVHATDEYGMKLVAHLMVEVTQSNSAASPA